MVSGKKYPSVERGLFSLVTRKGRYILSEAEKIVGDAENTDWDKKKTKRFSRLVETAKSVKSEADFEAQGNAFGYFFSQVREKAEESGYTPLSKSPSSETTTQKGLLYSIRDMWTNRHNLEWWSKTEKRKWWYRNYWGEDPPS